MGKTLLHGALGSTHHPGKQANAGVQQYQRRQLAAGQHVIADADLFHTASVEHALVNAFISPTNQRYARSCSKLADAGLAKRHTARRQVNQRSAV